jgi:hypothetical protein
MINNALLLNTFATETNFQRLVEWSLSRKRNAWVTSIDVLERKLGLNRSSCMKLVRTLEALGFARLVDKKKRVLWVAGLWKVADIVTSPEVVSESPQGHW